MKYLSDSFSVHPGANKAYRDNYDAIFGKKELKSSAYENENQDELPSIPPPIDMKPEPVEKKKKAIKKKRKKKVKKND